MGGWGSKATVDDPLAELGNGEQPPTKKSRIFTDLKMDDEWIEVRVFTVQSASPVMRIYNAHVACVRAAHA